MAEFPVNTSNNQEVEKIQPLKHLSSCFWASNIAKRCTVPWFRVPHTHTHFTITPFITHLWKIADAHLSTTTLDGYNRDCKKSASSRDFESWLSSHKLHRVRKTSGIRHTETIAAALISNLSLPRGRWWTKKLVDGVSFHSRQESEASTDSSLKRNLSTFLIQLAEVTRVVFALPATNPLPLMFRLFPLTVAEALMSTPLSLHRSAITLPRDSRCPYCDRGVHFPPQSIL